MTIFRHIRVVEGDAAESRQQDHDLRNGGSAADAQHLAVVYQPLLIERPPLPAIVEHRYLVITSIATIMIPRFSKQIRAPGQRGI